MAKRPTSHVIGDQAVHAVMEQCAQVGWACEEIHKDYGEDVLVQTKMGDRVDPFRILIQVKGTKRSEDFQIKAGNFALYIDRLTVRKWLYSSDLVVLVLWDVVERHGWWICPAHVLSDLKLMGSVHRKIRIVIPRHNCFVVEQLPSIAWFGVQFHWTPHWV